MVNLNDASRSSRIRNDEWVLAKRHRFQIILSHFYLIHSDI